MRKLEALKVRGVQELKEKKPSNVTKPITKHPKKSLYFVMLL
jgi:hypothetical protein